MNALQPWHGYTKQQRDNCRRETNRLLAEGVLVKPDVCEECGRTSDTTTHHARYDDPMAVHFLCRPCHAWVHDHPRVAPLVGLPLTRQQKGRIGFLSMVRGCSVAALLDEFSPDELVRQSEQVYRATGEN